MPKGRTNFYRSVLDKAIPDRDASVLVLAAGSTDKSVFEALGFSKVTFSNVDDYSGGSVEFAPFPFVQYDAESIGCADESFDYVVIHAALHHCHSPHRALLEMYRSARRGILAFEARDSVLMRMLERLNLTESYECSAVYAHGGKAGGVRNGLIPNFVYRWTEREVSKTIHSYAPHAVHRFAFYYGNDAPALLSMPGRSMRKMVIAVLYSIYEKVAKIAPKQQNLFAFSISKPVLPADAQPWIRWDDGRPAFNIAWGNRTFQSRDVAMFPSLASTPA